MTFEDIYNAGVAGKPIAAARQRQLLESRYNLEPKLDPEAKMSRGKPLPVEPTARELPAWTVTQTAIRAGSSTLPPTFAPNSGGCAWTP
jgi:hypothetical protein